MHRSLRTRVVTVAAGATLLLGVGACQPTPSTPQAGSTAAAPTQTAEATPAATVTAAPAPTTSPTRSAGGGGGAGPAHCRVGDLSVRQTGSDGHAGSVTAILTLTKLSPGSCTLAGFPELTAVDEHGVRLPATTQRNGASGSVLFGSGQHAYFTVTTSNVPVDGYDHAPCDPPAAALWLTLPGSSGHLAIGGPWRICSQGTLTVTAYTAHPVA